MPQSFTLADIIGLSKGWIPAEDLDEVCPPCRASPDAWLVPGTLLPHLAGAEKGAPHRSLYDGQALEFYELIEFPSLQAIWHAPDDWRILSPVPRRADCFWLPFDPDTLGQDIESFMRDNAENGGFEPGESFEIECYAWMSERFVLRGGRFERATAVPA